MFVGFGVIDLSDGADGLTFKGRVKSQELRVVSKKPGSGFQRRFPNHPSAGIVEPSSKASPSSTSTRATRGTFRDSQAMPVLGNLVLYLSKDQHMEKKMCREKAEP